MQAMRERTNVNMSASFGTLPKREHTRLWYRTEITRPDQDVLISEQPGSPAPTSDPIDNGGRLRERTGPLRSIAALQSVLDQVEAEASTPRQAEPIEALTDWRDAPRHCPILLLSANPILDARVPGPLLGPGTKYRIVSIADGVVCLQVDALDGQVGLGYCNAVDLLCYEPDIMYLRGEKRSGRRHTARLGLGRISQRIAGVTGSLIN